MHKKTSMKTSELVDNHIQSFIWGGILSDGQKFSFIQTHERSCKI